jgi:hypothetical protein
MPLEDQAADTWEPLIAIAIADLADGDWPARARTAAATMTQAEAQQEEDTAASVRLLADLRHIFQAAEAEALYTSTLLEALHRLEDAPWADWYGRPWPPGSWPGCCVPTRSSPRTSRARHRRPPQGLYAHRSSGTPGRAMCRYIRYRPG